MTSKVTSKINVPLTGEKITVNADNSLNVPNQPIIPFIEGDGIGADITPPMIKVVDAAVNKAYGGARKISWMEVFAGEKAVNVYGKIKKAKTLGFLAKPCKPCATTSFQLKAL